MLYMSHGKPETCFSNTIDLILTMLLADTSCHIQIKKINVQNLAHNKCIVIQIQHTGLGRWSLYNTNIKIIMDHKYVFCQYPQHTHTHTPTSKLFFTLNIALNRNEKLKVMAYATKATLCDLQKNYSPVNKDYTKAGGCFL